MKICLIFLFFITLVHAHEDKIVIATKRLEFDDFPGAHNPSLIKADPGFLLIFRDIPDRRNRPHISNVCIVRLNDSFEPISKPQVLNTRQENSKTPSQAEDARLFSYRGRIFLIWNDNIEVINPTTGDRRDMVIAELVFSDDQFALSAPLKLVYDAKYHLRLWQKNWVPFEWNNTLLLTYAINPHEILYPNLMNGSCYFCYETWAPIDWDLGPLRGSSSPQLIDGEYLSFFHSGTITASPSSWDLPIWHYFMGAYTFSAEPPFEMTRISPHPIVGEGFYTESNYQKRVVFPGGFVVLGPYIYIAYGKDDQEIWIATLDKQALKSSLIPVEAIK